jgi:hypothetical protein
MSGRTNDPSFYLMLGACGGVYLFFKGFRVYREFRVVEDTPEMPIRSIPMGLVRVHGKATGEQRMTSPITGTPCFFYKVDIEKWEVKNNSGSWSHYRTDTDGVGFYLTDGTGNVLVDTHAAELDLLKTGMREIGGNGLGSGSPSSASSLRTGASEEDLRRYVSQVDVKRIGSFVGHGLAALGPLSDPDKERKRQAVVEMFAQGFGSPEFVQKAMAFEKPPIARRLEAMGPQSDPAHEQGRREMIEAFNHPVGSAEFVEHMHRVLEMQHDPEHAQKFIRSMDSMQRAQQGGLAAMMPAASGRYRFTEYCLVPDQTYEVTGTCVENPNPKDEHDRNMIVKGQSEPTFLISYRTDKQVESNLRRRAALYVFGGAGLSIVCVALLLLKFGWL